MRLFASIALFLLNRKYKRLETKKGCDFNSHVIYSSDNEFRKMGATSYMPANPAVFFVLKRLGSHSCDSILDIGCGKGKALLFFHEIGFDRVSGVELNPLLVQVARMNFCKLNISNVIVYEDNALNFDRYDEFNYYFLYNPFGPEVLGSVIDRIAESYKRKKRKITLIYENPCHVGIIEEKKLFKVERQFHYFFCGQPIVVFETND